MKSIYEYTDYRRFLRDFYEHRKKEKISFSLQVFANKAGFKTKTFLLKVMNGQKNLSTNRIFNVAKAMDLAKTETEYFEVLIHFNEAKTVQEREFYFGRLQSLSKKHPAVQLRDHQFDYFSNWYNVVIRELVTFVDFKNDFKALARMVNPAITAKQAEQAVNLLLELNLVRKLPSGRYVQTDKAVTTGQGNENIRALAIQKFQKENLKLASQAIDRESKQTRAQSTLTVGISAKGYERLKEELKGFHKHLVKIVSEDEPVDRVYQINFQMFPVTKLPRGDQHHE